MTNIVSGQDTLFGPRETIGAISGAVSVVVADRERVERIIRGGHYSGSTVWCSNMHLLVLVENSVVGAMQFGPAMNPASGDKIVSGSSPGTWLELNRLWLDDDKPPNTGSRAISLGLRVIRHRLPRVEWIQSFADERCEKFGGIYQACSFLYLGEHTSSFFEIDGQVIHKSMLDRPAVDKRGWRSGPRVAWAKQNRDRASEVSYRQFRYVKFLRSSAQRRLLLAPLPYPKPGFPE